jgi:hypothetical protein
MATVTLFDVTITAGVLDLSQGTGIYRIETENGDPTDTITQIVGAVHPHTYELRVQVPGHYWTLTHNPAGNIFLEYGLGFITQNPKDYVVVRATETSSAVVEFFRKVIPET